MCPGISPNPFLCVYPSEGEFARVEILAFSIDTLPDFRAILAAAPDTVTALKTFATDFYKTIDEDRQIGCGPDYQFSGDEPEEAAVGSLRGVRYGFTGTDRSGRIERTIGYAGFDGSLLYIIVANALDEGHACIGSEGGDFSDENLRMFEPHLAELVENVRLPYQRP